MASIKNQNQTRVKQHIPKSKIKNFRQSQKLTLLPKKRNFQQNKNKIPQHTHKNITPKNSQKLTFLELLVLKQATKVEYFHLQQF